ncbi:MAG TPA: hypothetical protein VIQ31_25500 [Phormidium sp.]
MTIQEEIIGKENIALGTCTIPTLDDEAHDRVVKNWSEIERQFLQEIKRELERNGLSELIVCVTEIQEKRTRETGKVYPHLHLTYAGREHRYQKWAIPKEKFQAIWQRILSNFAGCEVDCKSATNVQKVKFSVKRYLSKYMSKGGKILEEIKEAGLSEYIPRSWFYCTRSLKQAAKAAIEKLSSKVSEFVYDNREYLKSIGLLAWFHVVSIEFTDFQTGFTCNRNVAMVGGFNDSMPIADIVKKLNELVCE